jgi:pentatricopeptide repeat protein
VRSLPLLIRSVLPVLTRYRGSFRIIDSASAIAAFDSIMSSSPSSKSSAVLYEAVIDACKRDGNNELASSYVSEMAANVRPEQDASALIRSYAVVGKINEARVLFESMADSDSSTSLT